MTIRERLSKLDALQDGRRFKIAASVVVLALGVLAAVAWLVLINAPATREAVRDAVQAAAEQSAQTAQARGALGSAEGSATDELATLARQSPLVAALGIISGATALGLVVIWLGLGLTYAALGLLAAAVVAPLAMFDATRTPGVILGGMLALAGAFSALSSGLRELLGGGTPWTAVARNVLAEAVRMKISMVFIVLLIFFLAGLPSFLSEDQPLRYRVQLFLQYGSGGAFWVLAFLTLFFSIATVAFEQRDKVIWQTMTKPVSPLEYLLGKWVGVCALNLALLGVSAAGVFLFTEHLRSQPAKEEVRPFVSVDPRRPSEDRRLLETQVLTARRGVTISYPELDPAKIEAEVQRRVKDFTESMARTPFIAQEAPAAKSFRQNIIDEWVTQYRSIEPGQSQIFTFEGLAYAKRLGRPLTFVYRFNSGADNPSNIYRLFFLIGATLYERQAGINLTQRIEIPASSIGDDGKLTIQVFNGDPDSRVGNLRAISFPPDGLEVLYVAGSYEANFLRVAAVMWLKLAFLAAVGVACATFLSFPVASLVSMGVFFAAETSVFLKDALDTYASKDDFGINYFAVVARAVAVPVAYGLEWYGDLRPTTSLVDGRMLSWGSLIQGAFMLTLCSVVVLSIGLLIFRKRELATYSGK